MKAPDADTVDRELSAIEEALAGGRPDASDPVERELQELALALRGDAPQPSEAFAESLGSRVREGFPRPSPRPALRPRVMWAAGALASLAVAIPVGLSLQSDEAPRVDEATREAPEAGTRTGRQQSLEALPAPEPAAGDRFAPGRDRAIERSAQLTLAAPGDELDEVADRVLAVTDRYRGFVLHSSVTTGHEGTTGGTFELRIPTGRLRPAIRDLSALADVRSRTQSGEDVTGDVVSLRDRLAAARAERRSLLRRLENATSDDQAEAIRRRLDLVAGEIRSLRSRARALRLRTDYATVSVSLVEDGGEEGSGGKDSTGDALDDALGSLTGAFNLTLRALGVLIPLGLVAGAAWLATRAVLRRRREAALS